MLSHLGAALHSLVLSDAKQLHSSSWFPATWLSQTSDKNMIQAWRPSFSPKSLLIMSCILFTLYLYFIFNQLKQIYSQLCIFSYRQVFIPTFALEMIFLRELLQQLLTAVTHSPSLPTFSQMVQGLNRWPSSHRASSVTSKMSLCECVCLCMCVCEWASWLQLHSQACLSDFVFICVCEFLSNACPWFSLINRGHVNRPHWGQGDRGGRAGGKSMRLAHTEHIDHWSNTATIDWQRKCV